MNHRSITTLLLLLLFCSCSYREIVHRNTPDDSKQGIIVAGTFKPATHHLLYSTSGIYVSLDDGKEIVLPWVESRFFELSNGKHNFSIWYHWFGQVGTARGCITIKPGQLLYLEYHPSAWGAVSEPELIITDKRKTTAILYEKDCKSRIQS